MKPPTQLRPLVAAIAATLLPLVPAAAATPLPGKAGVYCRLTDVIESPAALNRTMNEIKAAGIDFILPYAKLTSGKVNWDSRVAPAELAGKTDLMEKVVKAAHAAGLKVYPVFCVATEGGDEKTNELLERHPSWAFVVGGRRVGYIDPGNAQARRYEMDLMVELVTQYPVDGLSLDYMRAPNRVGYTVTARDHFLKTHQVDLAELTAASSEALDTEGGKKAAATAAAKARWLDGAIADLEAAMARHVAGYSDEWAGVLADPEKLSRFVSFVNEPDQPDPTVVFDDSGPRKVPLLLGMPNIGNVAEKAS